MCECMTQQHSDDDDNNNNNNNNTNNNVVIGAFEQTQHISDNRLISEAPLWMMHGEGTAVLSRL